MTPFPKKPPLSAGNRLFFGLMHILPVLKLLTAYYKKAYPGMSGYFFFRFRFYDDVAKACLEKNKRDAIFRFVSRAVSGSKIAFSSATENLITGENLNDKTLEKNTSNHGKGVPADCSQIRPQFCGGVPLQVWTDSA